MLTHTAEYALRAVLYIAASDDTGPIRVEKISEALNVPRNYLSKVMHVLARTGVLTSMRGPNGGFRLARPSHQITLAEVIEEFDPIEDRCLLMRRQCSDREPCVAHHHGRHVAVQLRRFFRETTVQDVAGNGEGVSFPSIE
jgi:Rrf2 family protein